MDHIATAEPEAATRRIANLKAATITGRWPVVVIVLLAALVFFPRLLDLDRFINIDGSLRWFPRSIRFYSALSRGELEETHQSSHPGVTVMLLSGASIVAASALKYGSLSPWNYCTELVFFAKLPIVLLTGAGVLGVGWLLARNVARGSFAALAVFFLAVDPLFLAHSRHFQLDATNAVFLLLSLLTLALYCHGGNRPHLYQSGIFAGLALLTRTTSLALVPYAFLLILIRATRGRTLRLGQLFSDFGWWTALAGLVGIVLWPAMWVAPVRTLMALAGGVGAAYDTAHEGTPPELHPGEERVGGLHFSDQLLWDFVTYRFSTALALGVFGIGVLLYRHVQRRANGLDTVLLCVLGFGAYLLCGLSFFSKAVTIPAGFRYALASFMIFQLMSAYGIYVFIAAAWRFRSVLAKSATIGLGGAICLWSGYQTLALHPYYQVYHNEFVSAPYLGWGEGLELVAEHLNARDGARTLVVASDYASVLSYYFEGEVIWIDQVGQQDVDYYVFYNTEVHRRAQPELIDRYFGNGATDPEFVAVLNGVEHAWLFPATASHTP